MDGKLPNYFDSPDITKIQFVTFFMSTQVKIKPNKELWDLMQAELRVKKSVLYWISVT